MTRDVLQQLVQEFLARGGSITVCPPSGSGALLSHNAEARWKSGGASRSKRAKRAAGFRHGGAGALALSFEKRRDMRAAFLTEDITVPKLALKFGVATTTARGIVKDLENAHR